MTEIDFKGKKAVIYARVSTDEQTTMNDGKGTVTVGLGTLPTVCRVIIFTLQKFDVYTSCNQVI